MVEFHAGKLAWFFMRKYNSCDGSPVTAVCAALTGVLIFATREGYAAYCHHINDNAGDDYLLLTWLGALALIGVVGYAVQHGIRFGF